MKYLVDTNVVSELVAQRPNPRVIQWIDQIDPDQVYLSVITIGELRKGIEKLPDSRRKESLRTWLTDDLLVRFTGHILALDVEAMLAWGRLMGQLERRGRPLAAMDSLIAALALHHDCRLVARNEVDFKDTGITIINPWKVS